MPDHKTHEKINLLLLIGIVPGLIYFELACLNIFIFSLAYVFSTYFLSPDLDVDSRIYKRWKLLRIIWKPYKDLFKHRHTSHHIIFGPLSLIGYLAFLIFLLVLVIGAEVDLFDVRLLIPCAGMFVAIELHILADMIVKKKSKK